MNNFKNRQSGAATLLVAVILLIVITVVTIYTANVGLQDQRISGNDFRAKVAFSAAQAGLDYAETYIQENVGTFVDAASLTDCPNLVTFPCNYADAVTWKYADINEGANSTLENGASFDSAYLLSPDDFVTVVSTGSSADGTGSATVREQISIRTVLNNGPVPPIMAVGVTAGGTLTVVGNPNMETESIYANAAGESKSGQLFSTWSEDPQNLGGSLQTCFPGDFVDGSGVQCIGPTIQDDFGSLPTWNQCACEPSRTYSTTNGGDVPKEDVVESPGHQAFDDPFAYVFKLSREEMRSLAVEVPNCDAIGPTSGQDNPIYWVTGDCDKNGGEMGSLTDPVIVIVEGDLSFQAQAHAWGIMMGIDGSGQPPAVSGCTDPTQIQIVGGFSMHGAIISDCDLDLGAGTFNAMYNPDVFENLKTSSKTNVLSRNAGSWRDF